MATSNTPSQSDLERAIKKLTDTLTKNQKSGSSAAGNLLPMSLDTLKGAVNNAVPSFEALKAQLNNNLGVWRDLSKVGANFSNDVIRMSVAAAEARVSLTEFADVVRANATSFAALGANIARGSEKFAELAKDFQDSDMAKQLTHMGYTTAEANDLLATYIGFMRTKFSLDKRDQQDQFEAIQRLGEEMGKLSITTGQTREHQMALLKQAKDDAALQARFRKIEREQGAEAAKRARDAYQENLLAMDAQGLGEAFKDYFIRGTLISEQARLQYATAGAEAGDAAMKLADATRRGATAAEQKALRDRAEAGAIRNNQSAAMENLAILSGTGLSSAADVAGQTLMKNLPKTESVERYTEQQEKLGKAIGSLEDTLKAINEDAKKALQGQRPDPNKPGQYTQVNQLTKALVDIENTYKGINAGVATSVEKLRGHLDNLGTTVSNTINSITKTPTGGDVRKLIEEQVTKGLESKGKDGGALGSIVSGIDRLASEMGDAANTMGTAVAKALTSSDKPIKTEVTNLPNTMNVTADKPLDTTINKIKGFASGGPVGLNGPEIILTGEEGPEYVLNDKLADQFINSAVSKLPKPTANTEGIQQAVSGTIKSSLNSLQRPRSPQPQMLEQATTPQIVERAASMGSIGLDDNQQKVYKEVMSLSSEAAKQRISSLQQEITDASSANREVLKLRDAIEEKYEKEGELAEVAADSEYKRLTAQLNASAELTSAKEKELEATKRAESTRASIAKIANDDIDQRKIAEVAAAEHLKKTHQQTAAEVQKNAELSKSSLVKAIPLEEIDEQATVAARVLDDHGRKTLNYAMGQDDEMNNAFKKSSEDRLAYNKKVLEEKNAQVAELESKAASQELSVREKRRLSDLKGEAAALAESNKFREQEVAAYKIAEDLKKKAAAGMHPEYEGTKSKVVNPSPQRLDSVTPDVKVVVPDIQGADKTNREQSESRTANLITQSNRDLVSKLSVADKPKVENTSQSAETPQIKQLLGGALGMFDRIVADFSKPLSEIGNKFSVSQLKNTDILSAIDSKSNNDSSVQSPFAAFQETFKSIEKTIPSALTKFSQAIVPSKDKEVNYSPIDESSQTANITKQLDKNSQTNKELKEFYAKSGLYKTNTKEDSSQPIVTEFQKTFSSFEKTIPSAMTKFSQSSLLPKDEGKAEPENNPFADIESAFQKTFSSFEKTIPSAMTKFSQPDLSSKEEKVNYSLVDESTQAANITRQFDKNSQTNKELKEFIASSGLYKKQEAPKIPNLSTINLVNKDKLEKDKSSKVDSSTEPKNKKIPSTSEMIQQLAKASGVKDVNKIKTGQTIKLPDGGDYIVKQGDTLTKIAQQTLKDIKSKTAEPKTPTTEQTRQSTQEAGRIADDQKEKDRLREKQEAEKLAQKKQATETTQTRTEPSATSKTATLDDVVARLEMLNTSLSQLISVNQDAARQQIRAYKSTASDNIIERLMG